MASAATSRTNVVRPRIAFASGRFLTWGNGVTSGLINRGYRRRYRPFRRLQSVSNFIPIDPEPFERRAQLASSERTETLTEEIRDMTAEVRDMTRTIRALTWVVVVLTVAVVGLTIANVVLVAGR